MNYSTKIGKPTPLGASIRDGGVNFSLFSPFSTRVQLLLFKDIEDTDPIVIELTLRNKSYYYWHVFVEGIGANQIYGFRVDGSNKSNRRRFDFSKVLVDPYAKAVVGKHSRRMASQYGKDNIDCCYKSAVINSEFDWQDCEQVQKPTRKLIIYEMHVGAFTKNKNSGLSDKLCGTYRGLIEKIPYLKELGVTGVELLPVYTFDEQDAPSGKTNFWGYSPVNFFSPHANYSSESEPQEIVNEFKEMVRELHRNNIEVILDVVYNHTAETGEDGPMYNFKGLVNSAYYILDENGKYLDYTGCGNTMNTNHSVVRRMIQDSLGYWVREMKIDGFRFDLASVLSRDESGTPFKNPPILWAIDSHPELVDAQIIAEPWDATGLNLTYNFPGDRWLIWNGQFRDLVRTFTKGDQGKVPEFAMRNAGGKGTMLGRSMEFSPERNLYFVTCHDGFTLNDLVSYNEKHNQENGESNRDGSNDNYSWNWGEEGETSNEEIEKLRLKQIKNMLVCLFSSHGIPMILMGDEVRRTQKGNNNAYCQDNETSWFDWSLIDKNRDLFEFVKKIILFRRASHIFHYVGYFDTEYSYDTPFVSYHGVELGKPDFSYYSHSIAIEMCYPKKKEHIFLIFNFYYQKLQFELPSGDWEIVVSTDERVKEGKIVKKKLQVPEQAIIVLNKKKTE
ncbi:MAG: isoamylase [Flavobacteriaceae bacterium]|jgi:glycogen operon protein|nr:isoamylase [Flavobacteriaceae bacterium]